MMTRETHEKAEAIPAILVTDLYFRFTYHPEGDFLGGIDDYFDTAQFLAAGAFDVRGVVLDNHLPHTQDGVRVLNELKRITNRHFPVHLGLRYRMNSAEDTASGETSLSGVEFLREQIEGRVANRRRLAIIVVAGLTDVAVALNRIATADRLNVEIYVVAGTAKNGHDTEYNVALDPKAYLRVMTDRRVSITWTPCDKVQWLFPAPDALARHRHMPLVHFLLRELYTYRIYKEFLTTHGLHQIGRYALCEKGAPMWSTAALLLAARQHSNASDASAMPFQVKRLYVKLDTDARPAGMEEEPFDDANQMQVLTEVHDDYQQVMTARLCQALSVGYEIAQQGLALDGDSGALHPRQ